MSDGVAANRRDLLGIVASAVLAPLIPALASAKDQPARILNQPIPPVPGPRRTIAVGNIDVIGPVANASVTSVGGAIAGMLETALSESGEFTLVERDAIAPLISEMDMAKSGVTTGTSAPHPGAMLPAQYLIVGSITDYTATGAGSGNGGGLSIGGSSGALTLGGSHGNVGIDLRIVDTHTGEVISAFKVHHKLTSMNFGLSGSAGGVPLATNSFFNSPLGEATRKALNDAVIQIAQTLAAIPWRGQVVKADGSVIYVNAGSEAGLKVGDRMSLQRAGETLTDPATGAVLKQTMIELGVVTIQEVEPKIATGSYQASIPGDPTRGDFLVLR